MRITNYLEEDVGSGDITTRLTVPDIDGRAVIVVEEDAVIAGLDEAEAIFNAVGCDAEGMVKDGDSVKAGTRVMSVSGSMRGIITAERTALNFLMQI